MLLYSIIGLPLAIVGLSYGLPALMLEFGNTYNWIKFVSVFQYVMLGLSIGLPAGYMFGLLGGANKTNYNDNSSGVLSLLNIMEKLKDAPQSVKDQVCFVFMDNEEKGLLGSMSFVDRYKKVLNDPKIINFDCVGRGKQINAYYLGSPKDNSVLDEIANLASDDYIVVPQKTTMSTMSDHISFGKKYDCVTLLCVDKQDNKSIYGQIHSANDHICESENIEVLTDFYSKKVLDLSPVITLQKVEQKDKTIQKQNTLFYSKKKLGVKKEIDIEK